MTPLRSWDDVAGIRCPADDVVVAVADHGARFEYCPDGITAAIERRARHNQGAEVAVEQRGRREIVEAASIGTAGASAFIVEKEEQRFIARRGDLRQVQGAAEVASKLIEPQRGNRSSLEVVEKRVRSERIIAKEFIRSPMKTGTAALGDGGDQDSGISSIFGAEDAGLNFEFGHRVNAELGVLAIVGAYVRIDASIEKDVVHAAA